MTTDKAAASSDQTDDADAKWYSQLWKHIAEMMGHPQRPTEATPDMPQASPQMLSLENTGTLPFCRTSC